MVYYAIEIIPFPIFFCEYLHGVTKNHRLKSEATFINPNNGGVAMKVSKAVEFYLQYHKANSQKKYGKDM